jgi:UDP-3-O-[3-hydroxymyristoyl] glucosamine N-acyltransferase
MKMVREIADFTNGTVYGDAETQITTVSSLDRADFVALAYADGKYLDDVLTSAAGCVLVPSNDFPGRTVIVVKQPRVAFANVAQWLLSKEHPFEGIHPSAIIHKNAELAAHVAVGPWTVIESGVKISSGTIIYPGSYIGRNCLIGADCVIYPRVVLYPGITLGDRVILHAGTVLGADGFGFVFDGTRQVKIPQIGHLEIGSDAEIGANTCIDRGALDETVVGEGTKIDNLCQIAHNVQVGTNTVISSQTGIAGSSRIGSHVTIGGQVGIADYCQIDDHAVVGAQCGVPSRKRVPASGAYWGTPARPLQNVKRQQAHLSRLPKLADEVKRLRVEIEKLKSKLS